MEAHNIKFDDDRTLPPYNQTFSLFFFILFLAPAAPCLDLRNAAAVWKEKKKENVFKARPARVQTKRSHTSIETKNAQRQAKSIHAFFI